MTTNDFDARAETWDDDPAKVERAQAVADEIVARVPLSRTMRALEYGCGTGLLSFMLRDRLVDVTLADVSDGMLAVAARKIEAACDASMRAVKLDFFSDPVPPQAFDVIYSLMTLHHIPDTTGIFERFRSALSTPGFLCIADLDTEDGSFHGAGFDGHLGFDRGELAAKARQAGFASAEFTTAYRLTKAVGNGRRTFPIFLMVARTAP
jgi:ubiquinone/menaquinone biosynthesis C-methylase UbiE